MLLLGRRLPFSIVYHTQRMMPMLASKSSWKQRSSMVTVPMARDIQFWMSREFQKKIDSRSSSSSSSLLPTLSSSSVIVSSLLLLETTRSLLTTSFSHAPLLLELLLLMAAAVEKDGRGRGGIPNDGWMCGCVAPFFSVRVSTMGMELFYLWVDILSTHFWSKFSASFVQGQCSQLV